MLRAGEVLHAPQAPSRVCVPLRSSAGHVPQAPHETGRYTQPKRGALTGPPQGQPRGHPASHAGGTGPEGRQAIDNRAAGQAGCH